MTKIEKIKFIYNKMNEPQKAGVKFHLFTFGIQDLMEKMEVKAEELTEYDKKLYLL